MCGRFTQYNTREEYLSWLADEATLDIPCDPTPIGRFNVTPGSKVLLLSERDTTWHLDPVMWSYAPPWWDKKQFINARIETAASSPMFKSLCEYGRAIVFADAWYEWKKEGSTKQPFMIYRENRQPLFFAAIGSVPFERDDKREGFVLLTANADGELAEIHNRRPVAMTPEAARRWLHHDISSEEAIAVAREGMIPADEFTWHAMPASRLRME
ncbi:SOS response-associated peptidase family protein [Enterobacteriaceae bacterium H11S18]|uniref:SOS response-associated peptidase family protein n=1 Tax=Dryocola clanedunensis TaxID=2925396 RepID=UPI0022F0A61C|nr:SOS response-associated peptidase family protein [Dryocola clanedunensis]MCT4709186.1 SOS response-associated peptidase family protein [Dryocola clanedunensis]